MCAEPLFVIPACQWDPTPPPPPTISAKNSKISRLWLVEIGDRVVRVDGFIPSRQRRSALPAASAKAAAFKPDFPRCGQQRAPFAFAEANRGASHFCFLVSRISNWRALLIMGGENCAFTNCTANRTYNKGLSYHKIPKKGLSMKNDAWREKLIQKINREDRWFTEQKKKADANIYICSRHFKPECFKTGKFVSVSFVVVEACGGYESPRRFPVCSLSSDFVDVWTPNSLFIFCYTAAQALSWAS